MPIVVSSPLHPVVEAREGQENQADEVSGPALERIQKQPITRTTNMSLPMSPQSLAVSPNNFDGLLAVEILL